MEKLISIPVFFSLACSPVEKIPTFSPSAGKPALALGDWLEHNLPVRIVTPKPVTVQQLAKVHDPVHVASIMAGAADNGFGTRSKAVANSVLHTVGSMVSAANYALNTGTVACAPVSGFHHAGYDFTEGFCTFNGLIAAAMAVQTGLSETRVGILDLDQHYGNGTEDCIAALELDYVTNISYSYARGEGEKFIENLPSVVQTLLENCDLLLYQAGADSHKKDPLGGYLTTEQMRERDRIVFTECKAAGIPVAWNLAGGYQKGPDGGIGPVLALHRATMEECAKVYT